MRTLMTLLREKLSMPVDIEFACDGKDFYLLQCRAQSYSETTTPAPIPRNLPRDRVMFSANRYISNGRVPDITHIVYVDPEAYSGIEDWDTLKQVGRAVGRLNAILPKRQFILMGPGRWGSRGDIKLGVEVTYSDINNTAVLLEIARQKGNYLPELSFGTHFFQDLVEADIRYIPLYPDDPDIILNELFLRRARNILAEVAPDFADLAGTVHVIDVPQETEGQILRVLMNADLDEAVGVLDLPIEGAGEDHSPGVPRRSQARGSLAVAAPHGGEDRAASRSRAFRSESLLRVREHEEHDGGTGERRRRHHPLHGERGAARGTRALARRVEPGAGRDELPPDGVPERRAPRCPLRHR